jgi:hypothetical protein
MCARSRNAHMQMRYEITVDVPDEQSMAVMSCLAFMDQRSAELLGEVQEMFAFRAEKRILTRDKPEQDWVVDFDTTDIA